MKPHGDAGSFPLRRLAPILVLGFALACRGDPSPGEGGEARTSTPPVEETDVADRTRRTTGPAPVLWLGLDGLDFELLDRLAAEGRMPSWKRLAAEGYTARLGSFHPLISPLLWTTIATGLFRALDAGHPDPEGSLLRWATQDQEGDRMAAARSVLERGAVRYPQSETIAQKLSLLRFQAKDCGGALEALSRFEAATRRPDTLNSLALFQTCLGRREKAVALLERSLLLRPDQPGARDSLNRIRAANLGQRVSR